MWLNTVWIVPFQHILLSVRAGLLLLFQNILNFLALSVFQINVQIIATHKNDDLTHALNEAGYGATILLAMGANNKEERYMILIETDNKKLKTLKSIINDHDPKAFVTISDIKSTQNGYFGNRV